MTRSLEELARCNTGKDNASNCRPPRLIGRYTSVRPWRESIEQQRKGITKETTEVNNGFIYGVKRAG